MNLRHRLVYLIAAMLFFIGCQDSTKANSPKVVRQKIDSEASTGAKKQDLASATVTSESDKKGNLKPKTTSPSVDPAAALLASKGAVETYHYQSSLDPFVPLIKAKKDKAVSTSENVQKNKRLPQTPLEKIDLSQLTLTAVFRDNKRSMAMVEESTGKGYLVKNGTFIGLDGGKITKITKDRVYITEISQDVMGKPVTTERELKLRQFSGE